MTTDETLSVESILAAAKLMGLPLTEGEAGQLLPGIQRNREMARTVRRIVELSVEPAPTFDASAATRGQA